MVVLGGWYLYREDRLCKALRINAMHIMVYWADVDKIGFAGEEHLTPVPEALYPILSDSISIKEKL